ncbi:MAG: hypothetical protein DI577_00190 [Microbacterium sp.]|nr:MAG: hypothetical protein DI577_00190 [Microbacterium sp.]PZU38654.1 MAG: hypothetical protein DI575_00190 [Microbacterium sp.]
MTPPNPLVAGPVDTATPLSGAGILDSGSQVAAAIESGDWVAGGVAAFTAVLDTVAMAIDPIGSLIAAGLGWLMDHLEPLKGWLNDLTGDAGEVQGFAQTWANISAQLAGSAQELTRVLSDVDPLAGEAIDAYRRFQTDAAAHIGAAGTWAGAMSTGLTIASTIVQVVHDLVRDVIAQLVGSIISWAAEAVFTLGLATPVIVGQVSTRVASLSAKVGTKLTALLEAMGKLGTLLKSLRSSWDELAALTSKVLPGGPRTHAGAPDAARAPDLPDLPDGAPPRTPVDGAVPPGKKPFDVDDPDTWPFDLSDPEQVYQQAFHNMDADTAVLGRWEGDAPTSYANVARDNGSAYFELGTTDEGVDLWGAVQNANGLSNSDMFETLNAPFLDDVMTSRMNIQFSHSPLDASGNVVSGALGSEFRHIFDANGPFAGLYEWVPTLGPHGTAVPR